MTKSPHNNDKFLVTDPSKPPKRRKKMNDPSILDKATVITVSLLLVLVAWDNAVVMLIAAALGLVAMLLIFRKKIFRRGALGATAGFFLAICISLLLLFQ